MSDQFWEDKQMQEKMRNLSPTLQEAFLRALEKLYWKESQMMLTFIDQSREEMRLTADEIKEKQREGEKHAMVGQKNLDEHNKYAVQEYIQKRTSGNEVTSPDTYCYEVEEKLALERYLRKKEKTQKKQRQQSALSRKGNKEDVPLPGTPCSFVSPYEEETAEIMQSMQHTHANIENERERQLELMKQRKEIKKAKQQEKTQQANELLERLTQHEKLKMEDKKRQEQLIREKLEEKKRKKAATPLPATPPSEPVLAEEVDETDMKKEKKKKKKKDKDKDKEEEEEGAEGEGEEKKKKKKKKKDKDKDKEEGAVGEEGEDGEEKEKKKKKKKNKDKDKEGAVGDEGEDGEEKEKKKKKKKKDKDKEKDAEAEFAEV